MARAGHKSLRDQTRLQKDNGPQKDIANHLLLILKPLNSQ
jgi:hypothetical protein